MYFFSVCSLSLSVHHILFSLCLLGCVYIEVKEKWVGKYIDHLRIREALLVLCVIMVLVN